MMLGNNSVRNRIRCSLALVAMLVLAPISHGASGGQWRARLAAAADYLKERKALIFSKLDSSVAAKAARRAARGADEVADQNRLIRNAAESIDPNQVDLEAGLAAYDDALNGAIRDLRRIEDPADLDRALDELAEAVTDSVAIVRDLNFGHAGKGEAAKNALREALKSSMRTMEVGLGYGKVRSAILDILAYGDDALATKRTIGALEDLGRIAKAAPKTPDGKPLEAFLLSFRAWMRSLAQRATQKGMDYNWFAALAEMKIGSIIFDPDNALGVLKKWNERFDYVNIDGKLYRNVLGADITMLYKAKEVAVEIKNWNPVRLSRDSLKAYAGRLATQIWKHSQEVSSRTGKRVAVVIMGSSDRDDLLRRLVKERLDIMMPKNKFSIEQIQYLGIRRPQDSVADSVGRLLDIDSKNATDLRNGIETVLNKAVD